MALRHFKHRGIHWIFILQHIWSVFHKIWSESGCSGYRFPVLFFYLKKVNYFFTVIFATFYGFSQICIECCMNELIIRKAFFWKKYKSKTPLIATFLWRVIMLRKNLADSQFPIKRNKNKTKIDKQSSGPPHSDSKQLFSYSVWHIF